MLCIYLFCSFPGWGLPLPGALRIHSCPWRDPHLHSACLDWRGSRHQAIVCALWSALFLQIFAPSKASWRNTPKGHVCSRGGLLEVRPLLVTTSLDPPACVHLDIRMSTSLCVCRRAYTHACAPSGARGHLHAHVCMCGGLYLPLRWGWGCHRANTDFLRSCTVALRCWRKYID